VRGCSCIYELATKCRCTKLATSHAERRCCSKSRASWGVRYSPLQFSFSRRLLSLLGPAGDRPCLSSARTSTVLTVLRHAAPPKRRKKRDGLCSFFDRLAGCPKLARLIISIRQLTCKPDLRHGRVSRGCSRVPESSILCRFPFRVRLVSKEN
jgi:hypothetical protein